MAGELLQVEKWKATSMTHLSMLFRLSFLFLSIEYVNIIYDFDLLANLSVSIFFSVTNRGIRSMTALNFYVLLFFKAY